MASRSYAARGGAGGACRAAADLPAPARLRQRPPLSAGGRRFGSRPALPGLGAPHRRRRFHPRRDAPRDRARRPGRPADFALALLGQNTGHLGGIERGSEALRRRAGRVPRPRRRARAGRPARVACAFSEQRVRRRLLGPGQGLAAGADRRTVPEAGLVSGLRAGRDVHRPSPRRSPGADLGGWRLRFRFRHDPGLRASAAAVRADRADSPHSAARSTTGARSRAASRSATPRRGTSPSSRPVPSTPTCAVGVSRRRRFRTRRSHTGCASARSAQPPSRASAS